MRLPSALAGIALVAAIVWLGTLTAGRRVGLVAAGLAALSPLVLEYGQQARAYVFAVLAATLAACALLKAERGVGRARTGWLVAFAVASIVGFWTHYTVALVCLPMLASSLVRRALRERELIAVAGSIGAGWLLAMPLMLDQFGKGRTNGLAHLAHLTVGNVIELFGAPFDTRFDFFDLTPSAAAGALAVVAAGLLVLARPRREWPLLRSLVLPAAFLPIGAVLLVTIVGQDVLLTRYVAVAVPFMLVLVGATLVTAGRRTAIAVVALAGLSALTGSLLGHTARGEYADWRAATTVIAKADRPGDAVILNHEAIGATFAYYAARAKVRDLPARGFPDPRTGELLRQGRRLWISVVFPPPRATLRAALASFGYRPLRTWKFEGSEPLELILALPERPKAGPSPPAKPGA